MRYGQGGGLTAEGRRRREQVRLEAVKRFGQRAPSAEVAAELRVSERSVRRWRQAWLAGGTAGLASRGQAARCRLDEQQLAALDAVLDAGPLAAGYQDQRWTLARIRDLVARQVHGAVHHPRDLVPAAPPRLDLPGRRAPRHRARRRRHRGMEDPDLGPDKRTAAALGGWIVFEDESGQSLRPPRSGDLGAARDHPGHPRPRRRHRARLGRRAGLLPARPPQPADLPAAHLPGAQGRDQGVHLE